MVFAWDRATALYLRAMNELDEHRGQGLVEYALVIAFIGVMLVGALVTLRGSLFGNYNNTTSQLFGNSGG